jgi:hypothetical protein
MSSTALARVLVDWRAELDRLKARMGSAFRRAEQRATAGVIVDGLLSGAERKTGSRPSRWWDLRDGLTA